MAEEQTQAEQDRQRAVLAKAQDAAAEAGASDEEAPAERYVYIKAAPAMGNRMALWDRNAAHPGGEIKVYGQDQMPVKAAADAPEVITALDQKRIVILDGSRLEKARRQAAKAEEARVKAREEELALRRAASGEDDSLRGQVAMLQRQLAALAAAPPPAADAAPTASADNAAETAKAGK